MVELKHTIDVAASAQVKVVAGDFAGVYQTQVSQICQASIWFEPLLRLGERVPLRAGQTVQVLFFVKDACHRYTGEVSCLDEAAGGTFEVADAASVEILAFREKIRISTNILCSHAPSADTDARPAGAQRASGRILDIDIGGVGMVTDSTYPLGTMIWLEFTLPETAHGVLSLQARVVHARRLSVKGRERFHIGLEFVALGRIDDLRILDWIIKELERASKSEMELRTVDPQAQFLLARARVSKVETMWDRLDAMQPQCAFGELGICCRTCLQGPCRIDPFSEGARVGICGASAETIVARNLVRMIATGASAHIEHCRHLLEVLHAIGQGTTSVYQVRDEQRLRAVARRIGIAIDGVSSSDLVVAVARAAEEEFFSMDSDRVVSWLRTMLPRPRLTRLAGLKLLPHDLHGPVVDLVHRTHTGVDTNPTTLLLAGLRCAMADFAGMQIATDLADILFGVPTPRMTRANLAVIEEDAVNLAVHGHNPLVSDVVCEVALEMADEAREAGASRGINVVGICCTGTEVLMRRGVALASNFGSQELAVLTGALDGMVVDYQCVVPGLVTVAECFHTRIFTTLATGRLPDSPVVTHVDLEGDDPRHGARRMVRETIEAFRRRDPTKIAIPAEPQQALVGMSTEAILGALAAVSPDDPLKALVELITEGTIRGVALLAGCNNLLVRQDHNIVTIARGLVAENVLVLATGCCGGALAKAGMLSPAATEQHAGAGLRSVLATLKQKAGIALPPVWHMGSCVDNSRPANLAMALADKLGVDLDRLPIVVSAPEPMSEKAVSIATWAVTLGLPVHLGIIPPVMGARGVVTMLTEQLKEIVGGYFVVELNPMVAVDQLLEIIRERRESLGI